MRRIKVAVVRGGPSVEHEVSLKTGKAVLENLGDKYIPTDVFIDKKGEWHVEGVTVKPEKIFQNHDVIFNALHGKYGENGELQQLLDTFGVKYTGSKALASAITMNKKISKDIYEKFGLKTPIYLLIKKGDDISHLDEKIFKSFHLPAIVKPVNGGSSLGIVLVKKAEDIIAAVQKAFEYSDQVLIEECIQGKEATCGVVDNFKGQDIYSLLPIEIRKPAAHEFFDYDAKYSGATDEICPGNFSKEESQLIQKMARDAHAALGLRHYSRSDFIVHPKRGIYILETNTLPGLTKESLLPKELSAIGSSLSQFLDHVIGLALI